MLKSMNFLSGKSRGRVGEGTKPASPAPVILGLVPRIFWLQCTNLVNKLALLLHKYWFTQDSRNKSENDWCRGRGFSACSQSGRSMIEMLGVLAIVAVLTVGGIAGYSKAMGMFKDNKQVQQISTLLYNTIELESTMADMVKQNPQGYWSVITVLNDLDRIPAGMSLDENRLHDVYGNTFSSFYGLGSCLKSDGTWGRCSAPECYFGIVLNYSGSAFNKGTENQCRNLVKAIAEFDENINNLQMRNRTDSAAGYEVSNVIWGKKQCKGTRRCFYNLTPVQLDAFCKTCAAETCSFVLYLDLV